MTGIPADSADERERLLALAGYGVLDTAPEQAFDDLVELARDLCGTSIALINLVDEQRGWFKAKVGTDVCSVDRGIAFCGHALGSPDILEVPDLRLDPRFRDNPLVVDEPHLRFYAGAPLATPDGAVLGTLCVLDVVPHLLDPRQRRHLAVLARQVMAQLELRRQAAFLDERRVFTEAVLESVEVGIVACDAAGHLTLFNRASRDWHGLDADGELTPAQLSARYDLLAADGVHVLPPEDIPLLRALRDGEVRDAEIVIAPHDRPAVRALCSGRRLVEADGRVSGAIIAMHDVTALREQTAAVVQQLTRQALFDPLTELPNRTLLLDRLELALSRESLRSAEDSVALLFLDLDGFKAVNDTDGHARGDALLRDVASALLGCVRDTDTVARLGGDEFVVLCEDIDGASEAAAVAARIAEAVARVSPPAVPVTTSVGIAFAAPGMTGTRLLQCADAAMYRAKQAGKARVAVFE
jgi:diguanylate cyclase (GGDEF)-like protein